MNLNNLDLNKLRVFAHIVDAGNYRLASETLNVTPSALSQSITTLEHGLGVTLFHRRGRKLVPTREGFAIHREFNRYQSSFTQALESIAGKSQKPSGVLRVGAYLEFAKLQLAPVLGTFQKRHPDVQIKLVFDTPSRLHRRLEAQQLDVCFSIYPERDSALVHSEAIYREELVLVSPKGQLAEKPSFTEVLTSPMIEYYQNHQPIRRWLALHFRKKPRQLPIRSFGATAEMVLALIRQGVGIGVVPEYLLRSNLSSLSVCRPTERKLNDHIWMLQIKDRSPSITLRAFTQAVERHFA